MNIRSTLRRLAALIGILPLLLPFGAQAQDSNAVRETPRSTCMAVADLQNRHWITDGWPGQKRIAGTENPVVLASATANDQAVRSAQALKPSEVRITYVDHSTFRIEDATGLKIATDYAGFAGHNVIPDVVTMNHAHGTHFTLVPDSRIPHVLKGWGKDGTPARYNMQIGEVIIRNVTTDINNEWAGYEPNGNSIFIFEMGGLCIGHLGHLHHLLNEGHYAQIGRLDVLMVPVDGGYTLNVEDMAAIVSRLQASLVLPMHWFGQSTLSRFLNEIGGRFPVKVSNEHSLTVSLNTLPFQPTVLALSPEARFPALDD